MGTTISLILIVLGVLRFFYLARRGRLAIERDQTAAELRKVEVRGINSELKVGSCVAHTLGNGPNGNAGNNTDAD